MHDGNYQNVLCIALVHETEWKPTEQSTPDLAPGEQSAGIWIGHYLAESTLNLPDEVRAQTGRTCFVRFGRRNQLSFGQRMEDNSHRSAVRAFLNTLFAGMPLTSPCMSSDERLSTSARHVLSASGSATSSKLAISLSAKRARERAGSFSTSSSIFLSALLILYSWNKSRYWKPAPVHAPRTLRQVREFISHKTQPKERVEADGPRYIFKP
jgi:hypothetical protein